MIRKASRLISVFTLLSVLPFCGARAFWLNNDYVFGSLSYKADRFSAYGVVSSSMVAGIDAAFYRDMPFKDVVYSFRTPVFYSARGKTMMFRPFYYPSTALVKSSAYGMLFQNSFNVYRNAADDAWTNVYTNIGFANQRASLSSGGDSQMQHIPEVSYEVQLQQYYFKEFGFLVSGAMFQYLRPVNGINVPEASFDQGDLVYMGTQSAIRKFPRWTGGVEFSRKDNPDDPGNVIYVGYHYVAYSHPEPAAHHANVGCRIKIVDQSSVDVGYDWIAADSRDKRNYYHVELRVAF